MAELDRHAAGRPAMPTPSPDDPTAALDRSRRLARAALLWEAAWPRLVPAVCLVAIFLALAWTRILDRVPDVVRLGVVALLGLAVLVALVHALRIRMPGQREAFTRIERDSGFEHRPLTALADDQAAGADDAVSRALWQAHRRRVIARLSAIRVAPPSPRVDRRDPYAIRAAVFLVFVIGLVAGRGDHVGPVADMLRLPSREGPVLRIDAWVTPPAYTRRAPVYLSSASPAEGAEAPAASPDRPLSVPSGSVVAIRVTGLEAPSAAFLAEGSDAPVPLAPQDPAAAATAAASEDGVVRPAGFETTLSAPGAIVLADADGEIRRFAFAIEPDAAPTIKLVEDPAATARGAFRLAYEIADDYRVAGARATFAEPKTGLDHAIGAPATAPRPLVGAPEMPLVLPRRGAAKPQAETYKDLSAHPWAGAVTTMRLEARDDAGNVGTAAPVDVVIPPRPFRNPVARMLVEQRRILALDANRAPFVADVLDVVLLRSPTFIDDASIHLGLRTVRNRILAARTDDDLRGVLDLMWEMALAIDGGDASLAEQRLREAREQLRDALQNGASPEEIARLTEEVRKALQEYMQALAEQMRQNPNLAQPAPQNQENMQTVTPQDFQKMLDRIEELSKLGDREAAEQLLSELDRMLENLQTAQPQQGQQQQGQQGPMDQMMNELADMIRRQQELMNETHRLSPDGSRRNQDGSPMTEQEMQEAMRRLQEGQGDLQQRLEEMMRQLQENGMQPGEQLGEAGKSMEGAGQSLGQGEPGDALGQQGQALDQLRRGAQQLAEQMGEGEGEGEGEGRGRGRRGESAFSEDPLGRPQRRDGPDFGDSVKVPGEIEVQRARRILEELRRRFSDPARPAIELDYLQRLLNPF